MHSHKLLELERKQDSFLPFNFLPSRDYNNKRHKIILIFKQQNRLYKSLVYHSNKIKYFDYIDKSSSDLLEAIKKLKQLCDYIVIYPTDDIQIENLHAIYDQVKDFCFLPFNNDNISKSLEKSVQYEFCEKCGVPYPKTVNIKTKDDIEKINTIPFPILIKPSNSKLFGNGLFRSLTFNNEYERDKGVETLKPYLEKGVYFVASEFIPGDDTNIYAYVGYRSKKGKILNEWIGKKLTQYPGVVGVFSSASNEAPEIVRDHGRKLLEAMNLYGICEPEFKFDARDGKYKLMEINLRSMMWHRIGNLSKVNIQYTQFLDAIGQEVPRQAQDTSKKVHLVYMKHEIFNLLTRKGYWTHFKFNVFGGNKLEFAVWDSTDWKPFLVDSVTTVRSIIGICLRVLRLR